MIDYEVTLIRKDPSKGFVEGNMGWVSKSVALMMGDDMSSDDFIAFCHCTSLVKRRSGLTSEQFICLCDEVSEIDDREYREWAAQASGG